MKNITLIVAAMAFFFTAGFSGTLTAHVAQKEPDKSGQIPAEVKHILEKSCIGCHSENGNMLAKMKFNFTEWNSYSADKQGTLGQDICKEVTENKMPPKKLLKKYPEARLSKEDKSILCSWATSLTGGK